MFKDFTKRFQKVNPDHNGPCNTETAVQMHMKVIENLTLEQSGQLVSQFGNKTFI